MRERFDQFLYILILALGFLSLLLLPLQQGYAMKALRAAGELGLLAIILSPRKYLSGNTKYIAASLFIMSLLSFLWYREYRSSDSLYFGAYINYRDWSLTGLFSAFALPIISSQRKYSPVIIKSHLIIALLANFICIIYSAYQFFILKDARVSLSLAYGPNAPGAAYIMAFMALYTLITISLSVKKFKTALLIIVAFANLIAIAMTGTRAGMIAFPILLLFTLWYEIKKCDKKTQQISLVSLIVLSIISGIILAKPVAKRISDISNDLTQYSKENTETSIGARFAMYEVGIKSSLNNFGWQSLEQRNEKILVLVKQNKELSGVLPYLSIHMHNQFVDTLSTTGWLSILLNIAFLIAVLSFAYKSKIPLLYMYVLLFMLFGSSDTLTYATPIPLAWLLALMLICSVINNAKNGNPNEAVLLK